MRNILSFAILGCFAAVHTAGATSPEAVQQVLKQYGLDSKILRTPEALSVTSSRKDGLFLFSTEGDPGFEVLLDRDYWGLASWSAKRDNDFIAYALNPKDEQSALNITIGRDIHEQSEAVLAQDPGFSGITRGEGVVANQKIQWRRWSDRNHLYSDCTVDLPSSEGRSSHRINVAITANSPARRTALEDSMASLRLVAKRPKVPEPTTMSVRPPAAQESRRP